MVAVCAKHFPPVPKKKKKKVIKYFFEKYLKCKNKVIM